VGGREAYRRASSQDDDDDDDDDDVEVEEDAADETTAAAAADIARRVFLPRILSGRRDRESEDNNGWSGAETQRKSSDDGARAEFLQ
jgi:hypothetical protein